MLFFKRETKRFEIHIINEWACPSRNPINITIFTLDLMYLLKFELQKSYRIEHSGIKIGILGVVFVFLFKETKELDIETKKRIIEQLENIKKAHMKIAPQPNAN